MHIEFSLLGGAFMAPTLLLVRKQVVDWAVKHNVPFSENTVNSTHCISFEDEAMCNFFALSFVGLPFRIVDCQNNLL